MLSKHALFEEDNDQVKMSYTEMGMSSTEMGFFSFPPNMTLLPSSLPSDLKTLTTMPPSLVLDTPSNPTHGSLSSSASASATSKQRDDITTSHHLGLSQLSWQRSTSNLWAGEEVKECWMSHNRRSSTVGDDHLGASAGMKIMKMIKEGRKRKKAREPRFRFMTMSDVDVLDDGFKWRKYGQKLVNDSLHPRSYYRCTQDNCRVKKKGGEIGRGSEDGDYYLRR